MEFLEKHLKKVIISLLIILFVTEIVQMELIPLILQELFHMIEMEAVIP